MCNVAVASPAHGQGMWVGVAYWGGRTRSEGLLDVCQLTMCYSITFRGKGLGQSNSSFEEP